MELHLSPTVISRGEGNRTACGSAAYRSCSKIIDNNGEIHNYTFRKNHKGGGVELPEGAPEELRDPQTLWQRHEIKDIRKDAQLYRDIEFSVPNELSYEAVGNIARGLCAPLTAKGMCVQWDIHDNIDTIAQTGEPRNKHVHMMLTMRELLEDGTFGNKNRSWNKFNGGLNIADLLRPEAARLMNEELAKISSSKKVEHESYAARGIDKIPQIHVGVSAMAMERKNKELPEEDRTVIERYQRNEEIKELNRANEDYIERLRRYHEAEEEKTQRALKEAEDKAQNLFALEDMIKQIENEKTLEACKESLKEPLLLAKVELADGLKACNRQIHVLKKDKAKTNKLKQALYLVKNLAGDPNLDEEQNRQLSWAVDYLKWAGVNDLSPESVYAKIDEFRENNTETILKIYELQNEKAALFEKYDKIKDAARQKKEKFYSQPITNFHSR